MHRLVQAVIADQMPTNLAGQWRQAAAALIEAAIPADTDAPESWPKCAALLPHAEAALADDTPGMAGLAGYLGERGSYAAALEFQQRVLNARERVLGPEHPPAPWPPDVSSRARFVAALGVVVALAVNPTK